MNSASAQLRVSAARTVHQIFQGRSLKAVLAEERSAFADGRDRALLEAMTLGTVRHRHEKDIGALNILQWRLLKNAWRHLRPGGRLLYSTCSVLKTENETLIGQFLQQHADARPLPLDVRFGRVSGAGRQRLPGEDGGGGFYYALLHQV